MMTVEGQVEAGHQAKTVAASHDRNSRTSSDRVTYPTVFDAAGSAFNLGTPRAPNARGRCC